MKLHIEMLGVPGSGKSRLHEHLLGSLPGSGERIVNASGAAVAALSGAVDDQLIARAARLVPGRYRHRLGRRLTSRYAGRLAVLSRFLADNTAVLETVLRAQGRRNHFERDPAQALRWILDLSVTYQIAVEGLGADTSLLLDEGFCNRAVTVFGYRFSGEDEDDLAAYVKAIPQPDLVVWVDAPVEVVTERLNERGWPSRFSGLDRADRMAYLKASRSCVARIVELLPPAGVIRITNDGEWDQCAAAANRALRQRFAQAGT